MGGFIRLSPAARIVVRPGPALQFGIDARVCGIIDSISGAHIGKVAEAFSAATHPIRTEALHAALKAAGLNDLAARSVLTDLLGYGILVRLPAKRPEIAVLGRGMLSDAISEHLLANHCIVRRPLRGERDLRFLGHLPAEIPLVAIDRLKFGPELAQALHFRGTPTLVPVNTVDGNAIIGPLQLRGEGPCAMCWDLHRVSMDPAWNAIAAQNPVSTTSDSVLIGLTASLAASVVLQVLGVRRSAPGSMPRSLSPGWHVRVDPFGSAETGIAHTHARCPLCFAAQSA